MDDSFLDAALDLVETAFTEMNDCLSGISGASLNERPLTQDTNSLTVLAVHSLTSTRSWLCVALGRPLPDRDRDAEFRAEAPGPDELAVVVGDLQADCLHLLRGGAGLPWDEVRPTHARPDPDAGDAVTGAWALMHAIEHLREHIGQMSLSRQLLDSAGGR